MLTSILNGLRGYRRRFDDLESAIFAEVRKLLPEQIKAPFDDRLRRINVIQPLLGRIEVNFYERRNGKILFPPTSRIVSTDDSIRIASVKLDATDAMSRFTVEVYCGYGALTSLEFKQPSEHATVEKVVSMTTILYPGTPWI